MSARIYLQKKRKEIDTLRKKYRITNYKLCITDIYFTNTFCFLITKKKTKINLSRFTCPSRTPDRNKIIRVRSSGKDKSSAHYQSNKKKNYAKKYIAVSLRMDRLCLVLDVHHVRCLVLHTAGQCDSVPGRDNNSLCLNDSALVIVRLMRFYRREPDMIMETLITCYRKD